MNVLHPLAALYRNSLQFRITVLTLAIVLGSIWSLALYLGREVRADLEHVLGKQQSEAVANHANEINTALTERIGTLERAALLAAPLMHSPRDIQTLLNARPALAVYFNGGFFVTDTSGTAVASFPDGVPRVGVNFMDLAHISGALKNNKATVSKPAVGKVMHLPVVAVAVPIHGPQGQVIGAFAGVIDLSKPNFLQRMMGDSHEASHGTLILVTHPWQLAISNMGEGQVLQKLPDLGLGAAFDRMLQKPEGSEVLVDPRGVEVLASFKTIPVAQWTLVATLPTSVAFAPVNTLWRTLLAATLLVTVFCTVLTWWVIRRQLVPIHAARSALARQSNQQESFEPLPQTSTDDIGQLVGGFNHLLGVINERKAALKASEHQLRALADNLKEAQKIAHMGSWNLDLTTGVLHWSEEIFRICEIAPPYFEPSYDDFLNMVHPEDRDAVDQAFNQSLAARMPYHQIEHRLQMADGRIKWVQERYHSEFDADGKPLKSTGTVQDITERKLAEAALAASHTLLATIVETIPMRIFWKDRRLHYLGCNTAFAQDASKQSPADLIGRDDYAMGWAAQADLYRADDLVVLRSGQAKLFYDEPQTTPDGHTIWLRTSKIPLKDRQGEAIGVLGMYEDISDRKLAELQLRKLSLIAEQSPETIVITNLAGSIEYVNESFCHRTGYTAEEVIGKNPRLLHSGKNSREIYAAMWTALSEGRTWSGELVNRRKDGSLYVDWAIITPLRAEDGAVTHYVAIQEDITERKRTADELERHRHGLEALVTQRTEELNSARMQADAANRAKSEFLANMSHEIRTPMNGVIGMVDVLRQTPLTPEQSRMLDTVQKSSQALLSILNDILDFSKIEAGKLEVESMPTAVRDVVDSVMQLMLNSASQKGIAVHWTVDPNLPEWVQSDPTRLRQILLNLVGNAFKFVAPQRGKVEVQVLALPHFDGGPGMQIRVLDNGIGMGPEVLERLFQPFTQADASTMRKYGGTGLGLSITQRLVDIMQGRISVQSTPGVGTEFTVQLPLVAAEPASGHSRPAPLDAPRTPTPAAGLPRPAPDVETAAREGRLILMAEDNETNRDVILEQLRLLGYAAEVAEDGVQALTLWRTGRHALLLTDCHMPNMDGFELTEAIRKDEPAGTHLPIIAITANAMQGEAQRCRDHGMDDYLSKPLRIEALGRVLAQWLPNAATPGQPAGKADARPDEPTTPAPDTSVAWDSATLGRLVGNNPEMQRRLLTKFLANAQSQVAAMESARATGDLRALTDVAHTLKSAARTVGALALGELCQAMETAGRAGDLHRCMALAQGVPSALTAAQHPIQQHLSQGDAV